MHLYFLESKDISHSTLREEEWDDGRVEKYPSCESDRDADWHKGERMRKESIASRQVEVIPSKGCGDEDCDAGEGERIHKQGEEKY